MNKRIVVIIALLSSILISNVNAKYTWKEDKKNQQTVAKELLEMNRIPSDYKPAEVLGTVEFLYYYIYFADDKKFVKEKINSFLDAFDKLIEKETSPDLMLKNRADIIRLGLLYPSGEDYVKQLNLLTKRIPDNGFVWMLKAEYEWMKGDFRKYVSYCHKALDASKVTTYNTYFKRNILKVLMKLNCLSGREPYFVGALWEANMDHNAIERHVTLLYYCKVKESLIGYHKIENVESAPRRYLSKVMQFWPFGHGEALHVLHDKLLNFTKESDSKRFRIERSLLSLQSQVIISQRKLVTKTFKTEDKETLIELINNPVQFWKENTVDSTLMPAAVDWDAFWNDKDKEKKSDSDKENKTKSPRKRKKDTFEINGKEYKLPPFDPNM